MKGDTDSSETRQPTQMTLEELRSAESDIGGLTQEELADRSEEWAAFIDMLNKMASPAFAHRHVIRQALSEGKPVPADILADYPDLVAEATETRTKTFAEHVWENNLIATVKELREYAEYHGIDLKGKRRRADIIAVMREADTGKPMLKRERQ